MKFSKSFRKTLAKICLSVVILLSGCDDEKIIENGAPIVSDESFSIAENSPAGTVVGTIMASDPEADSLTFSIGAAEVNALVIDEISGTLSVFNMEALDYESTTKFTLDIEVSDGNITTTSIITINLTDVPEYALQFDGVDGASSYSRCFWVEPN